jgi:AcrR family transcriptional regulator
MATPRRTQPKRSLRHDILSAARQMFADEGFEHVSMRRLAHRIGTSPTALYLHFASKDDLFRAICEETFAKLVARLEKQRRQYAGDALGVLRAGLREYVTFGLRHPEHYIVTFMHRRKSESVKDFESSPGQEAFGYLVRAVDDCVKARLFRPVRVDLVSQVLWMSIHGLVSLLVTDKPFPFAPRAALIETQVDTLVRGLLR